MYQHILVAVAFDTDHEPEWSLQAARALLAPDAKVTVLHVKEKIPNNAISYIPADYEADLKAAIRDRLEGLAAQFEKGAGGTV